MEKERFSLLLLEPGEIYFEDFSATLVHPDTTVDTYDSKKQNGRLRLCSKSLVFDPKELSKPIVKILLKECTILEQFKGSAKFLLKSKNVLSVCSKQYIEMLENNKIEPYKFCNSAKFLFVLNYASIADTLSRISQLHRASTLPAAEQADMIATIVHSRQARVRFDPLWLDLNDRVLMKGEVDKITPLVVNPGLIVLSRKQLVFQPFNNIEVEPVLKIILCSIKRVIKRRFLLRQVGLEIYSDENNSVPYIYVAFRTQNDRDAMYNALLESGLNLNEIEQDVMTLQWQNGYVSNYDYLMYLNSLADRTVNDLTQYPVFPWVISDYTSQKLDLNDPNSYRDLSKPVGALNQERLDRLLQRSEEMGDVPKFIYGSHYSTPAFVLFYLVRLYPHYVLCLQNGRFDHPDRMFNSCSDVYNNCLKNMSDFKELIPEFYNIEQGGDFLVNSLGINFGSRHNSVKVGDVELPPWAESPKHFVTTLKNALESNFVSEKLHLWIDLIFGYKQRGEEAIKANNLFYHTCYEGNVDLDSIEDYNHRHAVEVQIMEFGQIPKQIFKVPHPKREIGNKNGHSRGASESEDVIDETLNVWKTFPLQLQQTFSSHKDAIGWLLLAEGGTKIISVGHDFKLKVFSLLQNRQIRSASVGELPLSSCIKLPDINVIVIGSFDNSITLYDLDFVKVSQSVMAHEDAVTCLAWAEKSQLLASGSSDCTVRIWKSFESGNSIKPVQSLKARFDHNSQVNCVCFNPENNILASGTSDGEIYIWDVVNDAMFRKFSLHKSSVMAVNFSPEGQKLVSCSLDHTFQVIDINTGMALYNKTLESQLRCLKWQDFLLLLGSEDGTLYIYDIVEVKLLHKIQAHSGPITVIDVSMDKTLIVTGSRDHSIKVWKPM